VNARAVNVVHWIAACIHARIATPFDVRRIDDAKNRMGDHD
jgi:hypothetical protein